MQKRRKEKLQLIGWLLFLVSALFFIASSAKSGDLLGLLGGILFFVACIVFLIPFFWPTNRSRKQSVHNSGE